jgi:Arc/MetJ-type ribon-helix-helix transcriptional regulator
MGQTNHLNITLTDEAAIKFVRSKVSSGEYASESDVINDIVAAIQHEDAELEQWLKEVVRARYDSYHANPSSAIPIEQVEEHLQERRRRRAEARA